MPAQYGIKLIALPSLKINLNNTIMGLSQLEILIAVDRNLFRNGLNDLFSDVGRSDSGRVINCKNYLMDDFNANKVDVALLHLGSSRINGKEAIKRIMLQFPDSKLLILTLYVEPSLIEQVKEAEAKGHLEWGTKMHQFVETVTSLITSEQYLPNSQVYLN